MPAREIHIVTIASALIESLTLQGLTALKDADIIAYDDTIGLGLRQLSLQNIETMSLSASVVPDIDEIEEDLCRVAEALNQGKRVTRLVADYPNSLARLGHELRLLQLWGYRYRIVPNREIFEREAWQLQLPWLISIRPPTFRIIESASLKGDALFWEELATTTDTLAIDPGRGSLQYFIDQLLMSGADPQRPVALVSHNPTLDPMCWLTTLDELDELFPLWKTPAATILYIGTWPRTTSSDYRQPEFWGPLAIAADHWLRTGTLAETY